MPGGMEHWRIFEPTTEPFRRMKIIGLANDIGYNGSWCIDYVFYSRLLLCEDVLTKEQTLVLRPRNLWVHNAMDSSGAFKTFNIHWHNLLSPAGGPGGGGREYITMPVDPDQQMSAMVSSVSMETISEFCLGSKEEHCLSIGDPIELSFHTASGNVKSEVTAYLAGSGEFIKLQTGYHLFVRPVEIDSSPAQSCRCFQLYTSEAKAMVGGDDGRVQIIDPHLAIADPVTASHLSVDHKFPWSVYAIAQPPASYPDNSDVAWMAWNGSKVKATRCYSAYREDYEGNWRALNEKASKELCNRSAEIGQGPNDPPKNVFDNYDWDGCLGPISPSYQIGDIIEVRTLLDPVKIRDETLDYSLALGQPAGSIDCNIDDISSLTSPTYIQWIGQDSTTYSDSMRGEQFTKNVPITNNHAVMGDIWFGYWEWNTTTLVFDNTQIYDVQYYANNSGLNGRWWLHDPLSEHPDGSAPIWCSPPDNATLVNFILGTAADFCDRDKDGVPYHLAGTGANSNDLLDSNITYPHLPHCTVFYEDLNIEGRVRKKEECHPGKLNGPQGPDGPPGLMGPQGNQGYRGYQGNQGNQG